GGGGVGAGGVPGRRDPDDAVHRPPGVQEDGRPGGVHAGDGAVRGGGGLLRVVHAAVRLAAAAGDVPDPGVRRPGDHGAVVPVDVPWNVYAQLHQEYAGDARFLSQSPYHWTLAYGLSAVLLGVLSFFPGKEAARETSSEVGLPHGGAVL